MAVIAFGGNSTAWATIHDDDDCADEDDFVGDVDSTLMKMIIMQNNGPANERTNRPIQMYQQSAQGIQLFILQTSVGLEWSVVAFCGQTKVTASQAVQLL